MRIEMEFLESHGPVFIDGVNFGLKLYADPKKSKGSIKMYWDTELKKYIVLFKDKEAWLDSVSVAVVAKEGSYKGTALQSTTVPYTGPAQVETPVQKVQGRPGRPAKYQGQEPT